MYATSIRRVFIAGTALAALILHGATGTAAACPKEAGAATNVDSGYACELQRLDRQLVRCDNLTGAGVLAPLHVPEL